MTDNQIRIEIVAESAKATAKIKALTSQIDKMNKTTDKMNTKSVDQMTRSFSSLTAHVSKLAIIYGTFHSLVGAGVVTAKFEQAIKRVGVVSGASGEEVDDLTQKAKDLGESTIFSASQVADGMNEMAMAGLSSTETMEGVGDVLNLASVGMIDLKQASEIAMVSMKAFGLETSDLGDITDVFAKGSTISATTVTQLGQAMAKVATVAKTYNISLEETVGALGVLADAGRKGAEAGTQLKIVMLRLASNPEAERWIKKLGVSMYDLTTGQLLPFNEQLKLIKGALDKLPPSMRNTASARIFGSEAVASGEAMMNNLDKMNEKVGDLKEAMLDNFAEKASKDMQDTLMGSYKALVSALEGLAIKIGTALTPAVREMMSELTKSIRSMDSAQVAEFAQGIAGLLGIIKLATEVVLSFGVAIGGIYHDNPTLVTWLAKVGILMYAFKKYGVLGADGVGLLATKIVMLGNVIRTFMLTNPLTAIFLGVSVVVAKVIDDIKKSEQAIEDFAKFQTKVAEESNRVADIMIATYDEQTGAIKVNSDVQAENAQAIFEVIEATRRNIEELKKDKTKDHTREIKLLTQELGLYEGALNKIGESTGFDKVAKDLEAVAKTFKETGKLPDDIVDNLAKVAKAYTRMSTAGGIALDKLKIKEQKLVIDIAKLKQDRIDIDKDYYNQLLDLEDSFEERFRILRMTSADENKTEWQKKLDFKEKLLDKEQDAFRELYNNNLDQAGKYFDRMLELSDDLRVGSIASDGRMLASADQVKKEKLRLAEIVYNAKVYMIKQEQLKELEANKAKIQMKILELDMMKAQIKAQDLYLKKLNDIVNYGKKNPLQLDDSGTKETLLTIDNMAKDLKKNLSSMELKVSGKQTEVELARIKTLAKNTALEPEVKLNPIQIQEEATKHTPSVSYTFTPESGWVEDIEHEVQTNPVTITPELKTEPAKTKAVTLVKDIGKLEPQTQDVIADVNMAYLPVWDFLQWVSAQTPYINIFADTNNVYNPVIQAINWINSQVAYIDVYTRYHNAGGGPIPQPLAEGGVFTGSGRVAGYDPTDSDKVSAMLTGGEFVIKREAVDSYGLGLLHQINQMTLGKLPRYAEGGSVSTGGSPTSALQPINLNIGGSSFKVLADEDIAQAVARHIEKTGGL